MKKGTKLLDNSSVEYQLGNVLKELINDLSYSQISIASGYWDLPGMVDIYDELKSFLEREGTQFRLLLGEEPSVKAYQVKNPMLQDPDFPEKYLKKLCEFLRIEYLEEMIYYNQKKDFSSTILMPLSLWKGQSLRHMPRLW